MRDNVIGVTFNPDPAHVMGAHAIALALTSPLYIVQEQKRSLVVMSSEGEKEKESGRELPKYSWEEVAKHNSAESLWIVVQDKIYDVTKFMEEVSFIKCMCMVENQGHITTFQSFIAWMGAGDEAR